MCMVKQLQRRAVLLEGCPILKAYPIPLDKVLISKCIQRSRPKITHLGDKDAKNANATKM